MLIRRCAPLIAAASLLVSCIGGPAAGDTLQLSVFDGASEGAPLADEVAYFSFSVRSMVPGDVDIELISAQVVSIDGPVHVDAVIAVPPDHEQRPFTDDEIANQEFIDALRSRELHMLSGCGRESCEVVFAIVARRNAATESGIVRGLEVRYEVGGRVYVESTTFAIGLCLPDDNYCV